MVKRFKAIGIGVAVLAVAIVGFDRFLARPDLSQVADPVVRREIVRLNSLWPTTRANAALRLGLLHEHGAVSPPFLIDHLDDGGPAEGWMSRLRQGMVWHGAAETVGLRSIKALLSIGSAAVPALVDALDHPRWRVRSSVCGVLAEMRALDATEVIRSASTEDPSDRVRHAARRALAWMQDLAERGDRVDCPLFSGH